MDCEWKRRVERACAQASWRDAIAREEERWCGIMCRLCLLSGWAMKVEICVYNSWDFLCICLYGSKVQMMFEHFVSFQKRFLDITSHQLAARNTNDLDGYYAILSIEKVFIVLNHSDSCMIVYLIETYNYFHILANKRIRSAGISKLQTLSYLCFTHTSELPMTDKIRSYRMLANVNINRCEWAISHAKRRLAPPPPTVWSILGEVITVQ